MYDCSSEVTEAFCGGESCEGWAVDRAGVSGWSGRGVVGAGDGGGLLEKAGAEVFWEVGGNVDVRDCCSPGGLSAGEEEESRCSWGVCGEGQSELVGVCDEVCWDVQGVGGDWFVVEFCSWRVFGDRCDRCCVNACRRGRISRRSH